MMTEARYSWVVRDGDHKQWMLLSYRWTDRERALETAEHWKRHFIQVKTVEVVDDKWTMIE